MRDPTREMDGVARRTHDPDVLRLSSIACVAACSLIAPGCWLSHERAPSADAATPDAPPPPPVMGRCLRDGSEAVIQVPAAGSCVERVLHDSEAESDAYCDLLGYGAGVRVEARGVDPAVVSVAMLATACGEGICRLRVGTEADRACRNCATGGTDPWRPGGELPATEALFAIYADELGLDFMEYVVRPPPGTDFIVRVCNGVPAAPPREG